LNKVLVDIRAIFAGNFEIDFRFLDWQMYAKQLLNRS